MYAIHSKLPVIQINVQYAPWVAKKKKKSQSNLPSNDTGVRKRDIKTIFHMLKEFCRNIEIWKDANITSRDDYNT